MSVNTNLMKQNVSQINGGIMINVDVSIKHICENDHVWNPVTCNCGNGKDLAVLWMIQRLPVMKL